MSDDVLSLPASELIELYRSKRLSPVEVAIAALQRIERLDPDHNAFVVVDPEGALRDARASEARWGTARRPVWSTVCRRPSRTWW